MHSLNTLEQVKKVKKMITGVISYDRLFTDSINAFVDDLNGLRFSSDSEFYKSNTVGSVATQSLEFI